MNRWLACAKASPGSRFRLVCFPYAGGGASAFLKWQEHLPATVEVCAAQLPGRGPRLAEPAFTSCRTLVLSASEALKPYFEKPFALFGHSMGALISFELAAHLRSEYGIEPAALFVSGCRAPHARGNGHQSYDLPEPEFIEDLRRLGGTPSEVFESEELMRLVLPTLRADFQLSQTYEYSHPEPLGCPIVAWGGLEDREVSREHLEAWRNLTTSAFALHMLPGDHFFLHSSQDILLKTLREHLRLLAI
jgi:medium-chain acyl-[acyl-carrier-protein] hydrolase